MIHPTVELQWPRTSGRHALRSRELPEDYCREVLGHISQGAYLRVADVPECYRLEGEQKLLQGLLLRDPLSFRAACVEGYEARLRRLAQHSQLTDEQAARDITIQEGRRTIEEIRDGREDVFVNFGGEVLLPARGQECSVYDSTFG